MLASGLQVAPQSAHAGALAGVELGNRHVQAQGLANQDGGLEGPLLERQHRHCRAVEDPHLVHEAGEQGHAKGPMDDALAKAGASGKLGIGVDGVPVARNHVEQGEVGLCNRAARAGEMFANREIFKVTGVHACS